MYVRVEVVFGSHRISERHMDTLVDLGLSGDNRFLLQDKHTKGATFFVLNTALLSFADLVTKTFGLSHQQVTKEQVDGGHSMLLIVDSNKGQTLRDLDDDRASKMWE